MNFGEIHERKEKEQDQRKKKEPVDPDVPVYCIPEELFINYDSGRFKEFQCPINLGIFNDPVVDPCGHTFCKSCIDKHLKSKRTCPLTNKPFENINVVRNIIVKNFLALEIVKCPKSKAGCS